MTKEPGGDLIMDLELRINGEAITFTLDGDESDWGSLRAALREDLAGRGWRVTALRLDGQDMTEGGDDVDLAEGSHVVEVEANAAGEGSEASAGLSQIRDNIITAMPQFRARTEELGQQFARGEWRPALAGIPPYLEDLKVVLTGLQTIAVLEQQDGVPQLEAIPKLLTEFNSHLSKQAWVEVSDLLLYELSPLLAELAPRVE